MKKMIIIAALLITAACSTPKWSGNPAPDTSQEDTLGGSPLMPDVILDTIAPPGLTEQLQVASDQSATKTKWLYGLGAVIILLLIGLARKPKSK